LTTTLTSLAVFAGETLNTGTLVSEESAYAFSPVSATTWDTVVDVCNKYNEHTFSVYTTGIKSWKKLENLTFFTFHIEIFIKLLIYCLLLTV